MGGTWLLVDSFEGEFELGVAFSFYDATIKWFAQAEPRKFHSANRQTTYVHVRRHDCDCISTHDVRTISLHHRGKSSAGTSSLPHVPDAEFIQGIAWRLELFYHSIAPLFVSWCILRGSLEFCAGSPSPAFLRHPSY